MASKKKQFKPKVKAHSRAETFAAFMADLLSGAIVATRMYVTGSANKPTIEYDDPNG